MTTEANSPSNEQEQQIDPYDPSRRVGVLSDSGLATVKVTIEAAEDGESIACQVGDYILVKAGKGCVFGQVGNVKLELGADGNKVPVATVSLMNTIDLAARSVAPGVAQRPNLGSSAFICHPSIVRMVAESKSRKDGRGPQVALDLAKLADGHGTPILITPEMLFSRHMAILGTTGGGKSYTLTRLLEEICKHRSKAILFDPSGEFGALENGTLHVYIGHHPYPPKGFYQVAVPYFHLMENDLFAIFRPSGEAQAPKLRSAIKSLKLAALAPHIALDGQIVKANRPKQFYEEEYLRNISIIERPDANFNLTKLVRQITNECVNPNRSSVETMYWGDYNGLEMSLCTPLINRVSDMISSANLAPIFQPGDLPSLFDVIDEFLKHDKFRLLVVSMQYLSFESHAREIVANAAGRYLLAQARAERFQQMPILVAVDEAHQFLKEKMEDLGGEYPLDSFALIAKEGRKYGLHICLATQRPRDIPESVLSQMGSLIVHRLINDKDRNIIERACGEADASSLSSLPILSQGQAVLLGAEFPAPLLVQINMPIKRPFSRSADFQKNWCWNTPPPTHPSVMNGNGAEEADGH